MPGARRYDPDPLAQPIPEDATDDYYHYYMASQKRVSRWISQTQRELETATPMPVPSLFDVSLAPSAIKENLGGGGDRQRGKESGRKENKGVSEDAERGLRSHSTSTLVASSSSKTREDESPESRRKRKEKEKERSSGEKERKRHHHHDETERSTRSKSKMDAIIEEDGPRRERERYGKKRTSSMSPPPSAFKPRIKGNALALDLFGQEESTVVTDTVAPSDHLASAEDLARHRAKERREEKGKERAKDKEVGREREKRRPSTTSSSPQKSIRSRGRSDKLAAQDVLERRELDRQRAGYRSRSRATSKRSSKPSSSSGFDLTSTSFQALVVLLSSSMLMIAVAPKVGVFMSVSVAAAMVIVMNMVSWIHFE